MFRVKFSAALTYGRAHNRDLFDCGRELPTFGFAVTPGPISQWRVAREYHDRRGNGADRRLRDPERGADRTRLPSQAATAQTA